jgi:hypothetical protein
MTDNQNSNQATQPNTPQSGTSASTAAPQDANAKPKTEKTMEVRLLRGYFPESGVKLKPGEVHELPISVAKKLVNSRKAELPEDEA